MALDGILLNKLLEDIENLIPFKINKIYKISNTEVLFHLRNKDEKTNLIISCHPEYNRINLTKENYPTPDEPGNFIMLLRKHIEGGLVIGINKSKLDRWCSFKIQVRNTLGDKIIKNLHIELMGKYANIILVDENKKIIDALKRIPPFENNKRTVQPGSIFTDIIPQNKLDPFNTSLINKDISLQSQFLGFSSLLEKEVEYRLKNNENFADIMNEIKNSKSLFIANKNNEDFSHCLKLKHLNNNNEYPLHKGIDVLYFHKEEKDRIKQLSFDIYKTVKKELKHQKNKLPKLEQSLLEALDNNKYREYGELLYAYNINDTKGKTSIELESFNDGKIINVPLDSKLDGKANAKKHFQKYEKLKKGKIHIQEQINICKDEIEYFEGISQQLEIISFDDAKEIAQELINNGYIKKKNNNKKQKNKKQNLPNIAYININDSKIIFGKNNIQNDIVTFKLARKEDLWFHTKDFHGSHVILKSSNPTEEEIRLAANIAAYFSKGRYSSSVPVDYCNVKDIKKIPGSKLGKVSIQNQKTIYIDPDEDKINSLPILYFH